MQKTLLVLFASVLLSTRSADAEAKASQSFYSQATRNVVLILEHQSICTPGLARPIERNVPLGTGFFVQRDAAGESSVWLVTARHVVEEHADLFAKVRTSPEPETDGFVVLPRARWIFHPGPNLADHIPIDVAVARIAVPPSVIAFRYCLGECATKAESSERFDNHLETGPEPTDHAVFFGYPEGDVAPADIRPFARSGIVAYSAPNPRFRINGRPLADHEMFYVDAPSFPGNSGGPVMREPAPLFGGIRLWGLVTGGNQVGRDYTIVTSVERIKQAIDYAVLMNSKRLDIWSQRPPELERTCAKN